MTVERHRRIGRVADRVQRLEKEAGLDTPREVIVWTDDYGNVEYHMGKPRPGDNVTEIHLGGVNIVEDF